MTQRENRQRILRFIKSSQDWVSRPQIAAALGVKRVDNWELELLTQLEEQGEIEKRLQPAHPVSHLPYYQYRTRSSV